MSAPAGMVKVYGAGAGRDSWIWLARDFAARQALVCWYVEANGGSLHMTEGYRPTGVPADRYVTDPLMTSTGGSNQWYQVGRMDRGQTPSAIIPNANGSNLSQHSTGNASDTNAPTARDMRLRSEGAWMAGCGFPIASETWHMEAVAAPREDLTNFYRLIDSQQEGFLMALTDLQQQEMYGWLKGLDTGDFPATPGDPSTPVYVQMIRDQEHIVLALQRLVGATVDHDALSDALRARIAPAIDAIDAQGVTADDVVAELLTRVTAGA